MELTYVPQNGDISCRDSVYFVSLLRDAELSSADAQRLTHHIASCKSCQQAQQQFDHLHCALDVLLGRRSVNAL